MADKKISQLSSATTPLAGTEVLPIVQSGSTVKVATDDLTVKNVRSNATTGILQVAGPGAGTTRTMTVPNANFTAARTDAAQTFTGTQTFSSNLSVAGLSVGAGGGGLVTNAAVGGSALSANVTGNQNVAVGRFALLANTTDDNTAVGFASLYSVVSGNQNSAVGSSALFNATGIQNTAIGTNAGSNATTGNNNGFFGYNAQPSSVTVSNEYTYGNSSVTKHRFPGGDLVVGTAGKGIDFTSGGYIASQKGQITSGASSTTTMVTLDNVNENRAYWISVRQSGAAQNMVVGFVTTYGASAGVLQIAQSNTNPVVLQTLSFSGLALQLTLGSGYGSTTWDWVLTRTS